MTNAPFSTEYGGGSATGLGVINATSSKHFDNPLRVLANGPMLAALCVLLMTNPAVTSFASDPTPTSSVPLAWDASTETNVAGYNIYYGTISRNYTQLISVGNVTQTTITGLTPGTTYFLSATAYDDTGMESDYSNETSFTVPALRPELRLLRSGTESVLQWPTNFPGYTLEWSSSPTGGWAILSSNPSIVGSSFTYTNTTIATQLYYRLQK